MTFLDIKKVLQVKVRLEIYTKTTTGRYEITPIIITNDEIISINIDRRIFEIGTCSVVIDNTKKDKILHDYLNHYGLGYTDNHNMIKLYKIGRASCRERV